MEDRVRVLENQFAEMRSHYDYFIQESLAQLWKSVDELKQNQQYSATQDTTQSSGRAACCPECAKTLSEHSKRISKQSATLSDLDSKYRKLKHILMSTDAPNDLNVSVLSTVASSTRAELNDASLPSHPLNESEKLSLLAKAMREYVVDVAESFPAS